MIKRYKMVLTEILEMIHSGEPEDVIIEDIEEIVTDVLKEGKSNNG